MPLLQCLKWAMKNHDMSIELECFGDPKNNMLSVKLVRDYIDGECIDVEFNMNVADRRIERSLLELEKKAMEYANLKTLAGLDAVLELIRKNTLQLSPNENIYHKIIREGHTMRIVYMGTDENFKEDLYGGFLIGDNKIVIDTEPQTRLSNVFDALEDALFAERRIAQRKDVSDLMQKIYAAAAAEEDANEAN